MKNALDDVVDKHSVHVPVLLREVLELIGPVAGGIYMDGTLGGGGHSEAVGRAMLPGGRLIALDRDIAALDRAEARLKSQFQEHATDPAGFPIRFVHANYRDFEEVLDLLNIARIDGFLLDLGLSSDQLGDARRGFSFESDGPLDLRFDPSEGESASDMLRRLEEKEIADLIYRYGEERYSRRIARRIVERRKAKTPVQTARDLAEIVRSCVPRRRKPGRAGQKGLSVSVDPATRTFQALRIAVNDELGALRAVLEAAPKRLKPGGVMAVIAFHSLEDRIVKEAFRDDPRWKPITKKPVVSSEEELRRNPRARSAKLRAAVHAG